MSRLKANANPVIVANHRACRGNSVKLVGKRLQEVLPLLKREVLDVEAEVAFKRRTHGGKTSKATTRFRVGAPRFAGGTRILVLAALTFAGARGAPPEASR